MSEIKAKIHAYALFQACGFQLTYEERVACRLAIERDPRGALRCYLAIFRSLTYETGLEEPEPPTIN